MRKIAVAVFILTIVFVPYAVFSARFSEPSTDQQTRAIHPKTTFFYTNDIYHPIDHTAQNAISSKNNFSDILNQINTLKKNHHVDIALSILSGKESIQESRNFGLKFCFTLGVISMVAMIRRRDKNHRREIF